MTLMEAVLISGSTNEPVYISRSGCGWFASRQLNVTSEGHVEILFWLSSDSKVINIQCLWVLMEWLNDWTTMKWQV